MQANTTDDMGRGGEYRVATVAESDHLRLAAILDQMPVGIGIFDKNGRLFHANRHFEEAAGGAIPSLHHMQGAYWRPATYSDAGVEALAHPAARALNGQVATPGVDFIRQLDDGREHWVAVSAVPLTQPGASDVMGVVVVVENGEGRKRQAELIRAKEERFHRFAKHSSNALWIANIATGAIEYLSPAGARIWDDHETIGTVDAWNSHVHPEDLPHLQRYRSLASAGSMERFEYRIVDRRGQVVRRLRETSFAIPGEDGCNEDCIGGIIEDISPEVQIYLVQHNSRLTDIVEQLRGWAPRIKHFARAEDLMSVADVLNPGCVILDLRGATAEPGDVVELLTQRPNDLQLILIGSLGTPISDVIGAMRAGAVDFLVEPIAADSLGRAVQKAMTASRSVQGPLPQDRSDLTHRLSALPRREREVLLGLVCGQTNKMIARRLGISPRTVEVHRAHLMERLNARNLSELLELAHRAGLKGTDG